MTALPVNVLCGYLGSGKTTQLNALLASATRRIAVMVNDFGSVQIDADLIAGASGDIIRLTNGCVCCSMDGDLFRGFERIFALRDQIDRLVIEASGIAEPQRLTSLARAEPDLDCQRVVTMVCAQSFNERLADPATARVVDAQVSGADAIILSRLDVADAKRAAATRRVVSALNPSAAIWVTLDEDVLAGPHRPSPVRPVRAAHFERFGSVVVELPGHVDRQAFETIFQSAHSHLHRAKGFVSFEDDTRTHVFQYAAGALRIEPHPRREHGVAVLIGPHQGAEMMREPLEALVGQRRPG